MNNLDKKDKALLVELDINSRQSINQLAKNIKVSRDVLSYRMKRLERQGIIQKYITIIDFSKFGYHIIRLYIKLQNHSQEIEEKIVLFFRKQDNILTIYETDGRYSLAVGFLVKDFSRYQNIYEQFLLLFKHYVTQTNFTVFLDYVHYPRKYLAGNKKKNCTALSTGSFLPFPHDKQDLLLLHAINENARASLLELAGKLQMTPAGVKYKLKNLEKKKVIVAYKTLFDMKQLGYTYYKVDLTLNDIGIVPSLSQFILEHPNIIYRDLTVGGSDFEFDCECPSDEEFYALLDTLRSLYREKIRDVFYFRALKIYKYSYFPDNLVAKH